MFGLSWIEIVIILGVGVFVLGPERIPVAVRWVSETVKKLRGMASNAQADLQREIGPELDELRRQIADIKATQEFQDLKSLRNVNPRHFIQKNVLGDEFSGGVTGFLGLTGNGTAAQQANAAANGTGAGAIGPAGAGAVGAAAAVTNDAAANGATNGGAANGAAVPAADMSYPARRVSAPLGPGELAPFDSDGT